MIVKTDLLKESCTKILNAINVKEVSTSLEVLELVASNNKLYLNVTNDEYYLSIFFDIEDSLSFQAPVNALLFLKLVSQTTSEYIEFSINENYLLVKGNGSYKFPLIYEEDHLLHLSEPAVEAITTTLNISGENLTSILDYNSKELLKTSIATPIQRLYYLDQFGCVTFTTGACINSFQLEKPVKLLLTDRVVKLFKLFKTDLVTLQLGYNTTANGILQTNVIFSTANIKLSVVTNFDQKLLQGYPVDLFRSMINAVPELEILINVGEVHRAINRLLLFTTGAKKVKNNESTALMGEFNINNNTIELKNLETTNTEIISTPTNILSSTYNIGLNLSTLDTVLSCCTEDFVKIKFITSGMYRAIIVTHGAINHVIPEYIK